jgi:aspartate/methionine/tyrosine aminotransferase
MSEIKAFEVVEIFTRVGELERAGHHVVTLCVGEPDFPTPQPILDAAKRAIERGRFPYTPTLGIAPLREAIAKFYQTRYGVSVAPERIIVTPGGSGALLLSMGVLVNPGERVLMTDPGYPCNLQFVRAVNGVPVGIPVGSDTHYQLTPELIEQHWNGDTVAALIGSPANPTGNIVLPDTLREVVHKVAALGGRLIVDEIYQGLTYGVEVGTVLSMSEDVFVINSFSKYFQMTGWRLGWLVAPRGYVREVEKLAQNLFISNSAIAQYAALAAFTPETIAIAEARRSEFQARRDYLMSALPALGFDIPVVPEGAFYVYADCAKLTDDSHRFCWDVLERALVAIAPGTDFGSYQGKSHLRFSYCTSLEDLREGMARLKRYLNQ